MYENVLNISASPISHYDITFCVIYRKQPCMTSTSGLPATMLGLQGSASSSKVYRCVACSATFTGLASLLVHQATHASTLSKVSAPLPAQPDISQHESLFVSKDSSSEQRNPPVLLPNNPSPSFYICDCGEEFQDFGLMLEHKYSHASQIQLLQPVDNHSVPSSGTVCEDILPNQPAKLSPAVTEPDPVSCPSTSRSPAIQKDHKSEGGLKDGISKLTTPPCQYTANQDECEKQLQNTSATTEQIPETVEDKQLQDKTNSDLSIEKVESLPKNNDNMKLLASAHIKIFPLPLSQTHSDDTITPKPEVAPVKVIPGTKTQASKINDHSVAQLRRVLAKPGIKTKAPSISKILDSSKKRIVSLTKTLSPIVVLETRQKLVDPGSNGTHGRYQCGRCRRIFQSTDRLAEHHFLHKKERIKCCRRCKQLIIGKLPLTDNHVCLQLAKKAVQPSIPLKNKSPLASKIVPFHNLNNTKKVHYCPSCKRNYARRYNLKKHRCHGPPSASPQQAKTNTEKMQTSKSSGKEKSNADVKDGCHTATSIGVGTELTGHIKVEVTPPDSEDAAVSQLAWSGSAKTSPFLSKSSITEQHNTTSLGGTSLQQGEESRSWDSSPTDNEDSNEGQWTMPLDDEMELLSSAENIHNNTELKKSASVEMGPNSLHYFVKEGVKRYPCSRCQRTYSRASTLGRHLRLCGFRPRGPVTVAQSGSQGVIPLNTNNIRPMFGCFVCGKSFNRKDNMMVHRKKCLLQRTIDRASVQQNRSGKTKDEDHDGGNWGIMSLPSVLPRRVTCECGVGFTSPRLLLEHLQKHAQESYTCPTCGETVNSWADYEVHLQIHMHSHHQVLKGVQPQRSQPLLLRFQQQPPKQQSSQSVQRPPQKQPYPVQLPYPGKKQQRIVCTRCGNTFATRCSLRRHVSWNRCKGGRVTNPPSNPPKTYHCSHCNCDFPNAISLIFHQRSGACKPAIKPVRCPVCLRWFGTLVSLQKHLLTHKQTEAYRCDVCRGTYPNLKSLKNHRRRIHRIMAGDTKQKPQELTSS